MENKIYVENGRTIISSKKTSSMKTQISKTNQNILDEMQAVYDNVEKGYENSHTSPTAQNSCENCPNQSMLASILPLLKNMGGKNLGNIANIMSSLPNTNGTDSGNALAKLLPLVQSLNTKKENKPEQTKIDSFKRADE